jgi:hypothetical protein
MPDIFPGAGGFVLRIQPQIAASGVLGGGCHAAVFMDK